MKYLQQYIEDKQTELFKQTGTFFAFSKKQFHEQKNINISISKYVGLGSGMYCPTEHAKRLTEGLTKIWTEGIEQDIKENGLEKIIIRELANHEAWYTGEVGDTFEALKDYPITKKQIVKLFNNKNAKL